MVTLGRAAVFHFFGLLWGRAFILACGQLVIAGAAAQWSAPRRSLPRHNPILNPNTNVDIFLEGLGLYRM